MSLDNVGSRIKKLRKEKGYTLKQMNEKTGISVSFLSDIENSRSNPSLERLKEIADALDTTTSYLMGELFSGTSPLSKAFDNSSIDKYNLNFINNIDEHYPVLISKIDKNKEYFLVHVGNDSMNMLFPADSEILVEKCTEFINGSIAVVLLPTNDVTIRKVVKNNNIITLIPQSTDSKFSPEIYNLETDTLQVLGVVKVSINFHE